MQHTDENIYKLLLDIRGEMGEMKSDIKSTLSQALKTNGRVSALEVFMNTWKGKIAIIGICLGFIGTMIATYIREKLGL